MSRRNDSIPHMLVYDAPWWVSVLLAGVVYSLMRWVAPTLYHDDTLMMGNIMRALRCAKILDQGIRDKHHEDREATTIQQ